MQLKNIQLSPPRDFLYKSVGYLSFIVIMAILPMSATAGGGIFGHKHKTVNTNGVHSIGVHICGSLECPPVRIFEGKCDKEHMSMHWGVCVCDKGYVPKDGKCDACPEGQYSDGIHGCKSCPDGMYAEAGDTKCTTCPTPTETICNGDPAKDSHNCPTQNFVECSGTTPVCKADNKTCECPENANCTITPWACNDGYFRNADTCVKCPDEHATTCDHTGKSTACMDGYYLGDTQCVADGKCSDGSDPVVKTYQYGVCCDTEINALFCPNENPPTCEPSPACSCTGDDIWDQGCCDGEGWFIADLPECCSSKSQSENCCRDVGGQWDGHCCDGTWTGKDCCYGKWDGTQCCPFFDAQGNCCTSVNDNQACCEASFGDDWWHRAWTGSKCCYYWAASDNKCCEEDGTFLSDGGYCCYSENTNENCCIDRGGRWDGSKCCTLTKDDCPGGVDYENCVCNTEGQPCTDHTTNQCGLGYYCKFSPSGCGDSDRGNGVCTAISGGTKVDGHWVDTEESQLDWWSANSWCIGKGSSGSISYATLQAQYGCDKDNYSCDWKLFRDKGFGDNIYWTDEISSQNSCLARIITDTDFGFLGRSIDIVRSLCE